MAAEARTGREGDRRPGFQPEDLLRQAQVQDLALSSDGSIAVYSRRVIADGRYRTNIWLVPWSGGDARQLTHVVANDTLPVFSPDGSSLVFISDRGDRKQRRTATVQVDASQSKPHKTQHLQ